MNQLSPLVHPCDSLCFWYCHVLLSIVFQVCLFFWIPVFQVLWIVSHDEWGSSWRGIIERLRSGVKGTEECRQWNRRPPPPVGLEPAARCAGKRQAERREPKGVAKAATMWVSRVPRPLLRFALRARFYLRTAVDEKSISIQPCRRRRRRSSPACRSRGTCCSFPRSSSSSCSCRSSWAWSRRRTCPRSRCSASS